MLQKDKPNEYVISTGKTHSIREFLTYAFEHIGVTDWEKYVKQDPRYMRPAEVDVLLGDSTKAQTELNWKPKTSLKEMVEKMVNNDIKKLKNLKKLNIDTTQEEQHIERTFHTILDSFQKLNMYIYNKYKDDSEMRAALTNILMRIEDLSEHYYWVRIKERQNQDLEREEEDLEKH